MKEIALLLGLLIAPLGMTLDCSASPRAARLAITYQDLLGKPFGGAGEGGPGIAGVYEFVFTPRFSFGIDLAYRAFGGGIHQLGYGLLMKHYLADEETGIRPYLEYGLLFNVTRLKGRTGSGTAHDTQLAAGIDFGLLGAPFFFDLAYHYSRLGYFNVATENLDYLEVNLGWRYRW